MPDPEEVRDYWNRKAREFGTDPAATMKDFNLRSLEVRRTLGCLREDDVLCDVGAGNACASLEYAKRCRRVVAADSSEDMVEKARLAVSDAGSPNVTVLQGGVLDLDDYRPRDCTVVNCTRVLINLQTHEWPSALDVLTKAPRLILTEGCEEGFRGLNACRARVGLSPIPLNWHNTLLNRSVLEGRLLDSYDHVERFDYGVYYLLSRVAHPLAVAPAEPEFDARINRAAVAVQQSMPAGFFDAADFSILVTYHCR